MRSFCTPKERVKGAETQHLLLLLLEENSRKIAGQVCGHSLYGIIRYMSHTTVRSSASVFLQLLFKDIHQMSDLTNSFYSSSRKPTLSHTYQPSSRRMSSANLKNNARKESIVSFFIIFFYSSQKHKFANGGTR